MQIILSYRHIVQESLGLGRVHALGSCCINKALFLKIEEGFNLLYLVHQSTTNLVHHCVSLIGHVRLDVAALEVLHDLSRNFSKDFA